MAERRMFSKEVVSSDTFLSLPARAQALYTQLCLYADDEGLLGNPTSIVRAAGRTMSDLKILEAAGYVHRFSSGVLVIIDWHKNNAIRQDRVHNTVYKEERERLGITKQKRYFLTTTCQPTDNQLTTTFQSNNQSLSAQIRLDKTRLDKVSIEQRPTVKPTAKGKSPAEPVFKSLPDSFERIGYAATEDLKKQTIVHLDQAAQHTTAKPPEDDPETRQLKQAFRQKAATDGAPSPNTPANTGNEIRTEVTAQTPAAALSDPPTQTDPEGK